ncbi:Scr1 family TA system antitoxin-like transcriptional regulator [Actinocorallia sp. A-T 12471]|uniref:Scr1 family TA system antitoxin-like transcriptional regulator n=1 Tax=Actinocorallia sp. A-T 12471 TaxID=3089813 RepID=UPI0029D04BE7|nr:Scr1 family TA system antitoxin-like transcriptional regulator [Actinocorallia sp. A-T 12471]MDX6739206.1 Scr1 family TA system antitoxin-like transcriptional regulator [Actinocorallia sp. A-T 12471]
MRVLPELIAAHRDAEQMWTEHKRALKVGLKQVQAEGDIYERTKLLRAYESNRLPGILQTPGYVRALLAMGARVHQLPEDEDVDGAAAGRLSRKRLLTHGTGLNRYSFVLEASALDLAMGGREAMQEQFDFLLAATRLPHVSLGIIPPGSEREIWAGEGFIAN